MDINRDYLGDGVYIHYTGHDYEISVNDHRNAPVVVLDDDIIDKLIRFRERVKNGKRKA